MVEPPATIEHLPYEILEKIIPDLKPKTISTLKLVNSRFYHLLINDKYYKPYLHYPVKHYLCEMKNEKNSGKEVVEEIKNGTIGKWKGYLTLQNLHLGNLKGGNITGCEIVSLAPPLLDESQYDMTLTRCWNWRHRIDEDGEYWLVSKNRDGHIELVNITNEPKTYVEREISPSCCLILLPGQVICWQERNLHIVVFNIVNTGGEISLQRHLDFEVQTYGSGFATVKCKSSGKRRNLLAYWTREFQSDGTVHFRDLATGDVPAAVRLWDYPCLKKFDSAPFRMHVREFYDNGSRHDHEAYEESPYIAFRMGFVNYASPSESADVIVVFNVDSMKATSFARITTQFARAYGGSTESASVRIVRSPQGVHLTRNGVYIVAMKQTAVDFSGCGYSVEVDVIPLEGHGDVDELRVPKIYNVGDIRTSKEFFWIFVWSKILLNGKLLLRINAGDDGTAELRVVRLDNPEIYDVVRVTLDDKAKLLVLGEHVIGHDLLVVHLLLEKNIFTGFPVKMFKIVKNQESAVAEELITWGKMLSDYNINFREPELVFSNDVSKLVIYDRCFGGNDQLAIFHF